MNCPTTYAQRNFGEITRAVLAGKKVTLTIHDQPAILMIPIKKAKAKKAK